MPGTRNHAPEIVEPRDADDVVGGLRDVGGGPRVVGGGPRVVGGSVGGPPVGTDVGTPIVVLVACSSFPPASRSEIRHDGTATTEDTGAPIVAVVSGERTGGGAGARTAAGSGWRGCRPARGGGDRRTVGSQAGHEPVEEVRRDTPTARRAIGAAW